MICGQHNCGQQCCGYFCAKDEKFCWKCTKLLPTATPPCLWGKGGEKKKWTIVKKMSHENCLEHNKELELLEHNLSTKVNLGICWVFYRKCLEIEKVGDCYRNLKELSLRTKTEDNSHISQLVLLCVIFQSVGATVTPYFNSFQFWRLLSSHLGLWVAFNLLASKNLIFRLPHNLVTSIPSLIHCISFYICMVNLTSPWWSLVMVNNRPEGGKTHNFQLSTLIVWRS